MKLICNNEVIYDKPILGPLTGHRCDHVLLSMADFVRLALLAESEIGREQLAEFVRYMPLKFRPESFAPELPIKRSEKLKLRRPTGS